MKSNYFSNINCIFEQIVRINTIPIVNIITSNSDFKTTTTMAEP